MDDLTTTQEIARRIYRTPEAMDNYLRLYDRILLPKYYHVPASAMPRITSHSPRLLEEHLALATKHFPDEDSLIRYIGKRGIRLDVRR